MLEGHNGAGFFDPVNRLFHSPRLISDFCCPKLRDSVPVSRSVGCFFFFSEQLTCICSPGSEQ